MACSSCLTAAILAGLLSASISTICMTSVSRPVGIAWTLDPSGANLKGVCDGSSPVSNWWSVAPKPYMSVRGVVCACILAYCSGAA